MMKENKIGAKILKIVGGVLLYVCSFALILSITLFSAVYIISKSRAASVKELFVVTMCDTGALDFLAHMFLSDAEVEEILAKNSIIVPEGETDVSLIEIVGDDDDSEIKKKTEAEDKKLGIEYDEDGVCLISITGKTYVGKILVVKDPKRVEVVGLPKYGEGIVGKTTEQMAIESNALAAVNGGGYAEMSDYKTGGMPEGRNGGGLVIIDGELRWGNRQSTYEVIGFDRDGILHVDDMTAQNALDIGIISAVNWGPVLVKNGEPCVINSESTNPGFHPRTAIGQRADGSVILLVIDGRQAHSVGASYEDLVEVMMRYGAVNAANLDGGMSSYMVYKNEIITSPYMLYWGGKRTVSTSIIVKK